MSFVCVKVDRRDIVLSRIVEESSSDGQLLSLRGRGAWIGAKDGCQSGLI